MSNKQANKIVKAIWEDIDGRSGGDHFLHGCDDDIQQEMKDTWKDLIMKILEAKS